jgi:hypothetical protein
MQDFDDEELDVDALVFIIGYILKMLVWLWMIHTRIYTKV